MRTANEQAAAEAAAKAQQAIYAQKDAERKLKEGIHPIVMPTDKEMADAMKEMQWKDDLFHFAIAGGVAGGKSSLINAFRGLRNRDCGAAPTGIPETTLTMARFPDSNLNYPCVWYDIHGAGTLRIPDWQYFNAQGFYLFDCIMVLFNYRFMMTDIAILTNARRFHIPTYIIQSKADQHIRNMVAEMGYDSEYDDKDRRDQLLQAARTQFITETRRSVKLNLQNANLPDQKVYIVSKDCLLRAVKGERSKNVIDELGLLTDLYNEAHARRSCAAPVS